MPELEQIEQIAAPGDSIHITYTTPHGRTCYAGSGGMKKRAFERALSLTANAVERRYLRRAHRKTQQRVASR